MKYLDALAIAKLKNLNLELRRLASEGHLSGRHRSLWRGFSRDFAQHRPYVPGDEVKALDWKVYARKDRFYVREYRAESILTTQLLVDASGSMAFAGPGRAPKWDQACRLAMGMATLVVGKGDAAGLITFDDRPRDFLPPRAALSQLELMDAALSERGPGGETDLRAALEQAGLRIRRRSLLILISDLLGDPEGILKALKAFKARKHEILVLQVLDPLERDFAFEGPTLFESLEDQSRLFCDAGALGPLYRAEFERLLKIYEASFHLCEIPYAPFYTDVPWETALGRFLTRLQ